MTKAARELERYLHENIPITAAMGARVLEATPERVGIGAPLAPNINHRDTVFGGSAAAIATLAAWALVHVRLRRRGIANRLVIQRGSTSYPEPIDGDFVAESVAPTEDEWQRFVRALERRGRARIRVAATLSCRGRGVGSFEGDFVALRPDAARV